MTLDYRPHLPTKEQSRIAAATPREHATARLQNPRARTLFDQWAELAQQPFVGITTHGTSEPGLFTLRPEGAPIEPMATAATSFVDHLSVEDRDRAHHPIGSPLWRQWQNTEMFVEEHGLRLDLCDTAVRDRAMEVVQASLSPRGYDETLGVMRLNGWLGQLLDAPGVLGEWSYNFCLFGDPSPIDPWGWQLWGHHLALSCVIVGEQMTLTPAFLGAEIAYADAGPHAGLRLFGDHERLGLELINSLPARLRDQAVVNHSLVEDLPEGRRHFADYLMLGGAFQDNRIVPYEGLTADLLTKAQTDRLLSLVEAYARTLPDGPHDARMTHVEEHLADTRFCWIGGLGPDDPFYYRIQSPVIFIEFDHHPGLFLTNPDPAKFHVHTVVRTPNGNDFGIDLLRQHHHHHHGHGDHHD